MFIGDSSFVLRTTGREVCWKDIGVGFLALMTIACLIVGIVNFIAYKCYNDEKYLSRRNLGFKTPSKKSLKITATIFLSLLPLTIIINIFVCCFA